MPPYNCRAATCGWYARRLSGRVLRTSLREWTQDRSSVYVINWIFGTPFNHGMNSCGVRGRKCRLLLLRIPRSKLITADRVESRGQVLYEGAAMGPSLGQRFTNHGPECVRGGLNRCGARCTSDIKVQELGTQLTATPES